MKWLARILHVLLIPLIGSAGLFKLVSSAETIREVYTDPLGYSAWFIYLIGVFELLAAVGLIIGFWRSGVGFASLGVIFIILAGAVGSNLYAGLYTDAISPLIGLILTTVVYLLNRYWIKAPRGAVKHNQTIQ